MSGLMPAGPLAYEGQVVVPFIQRTFPPTNSFTNFPIPTIWVDSANMNGYMLVSKALGVADWILLGGSPGVLNTLTGDTGGAISPIAANIDIVGGLGVSVDGSAGQLQINVTGAGVAWNEITTTSDTMVGNNGYIASNGALVTLTLPTTCAQGAEIKIVGKGAGGWLIAQNVGQQIFFGSSSTTAGVTGSLASTNRRDCVTLVCITANTEFEVIDSIGNITVV